MSLIQILETFKSDPSIAGNITHWQIFPAREGVYHDYPDYLDPKLIRILQGRGVKKLYCHLSRVSLPILSNFDKSSTYPSRRFERLGY